MECLLSVHLGLLWNKKGIMTLKSYKFNCKKGIQFLIQKSVGVAVYFIFGA